MSRRAEGQLFVGRLSKDTRTRDLEDIFETYGRIIRCELKYGAEMGYAFVDYEDRRDAEDAMRYENGRDVCGSSIIVEWAKGNPRRTDGGGGGRGGGGGGGATRLGYDECYKCHRVGHWARDCPDDRSYGFRRPRGGQRSRSRSRSPVRRRRSRSRERRRRSYSRSQSRSRSRDRKRSRRSRSAEKSASKSPGHQRDSRRSKSPDQKADARRSRSQERRSATRSPSGERSDKKVEENGSGRHDEEEN